MATGTVGEEVWKSVRLVWREELWLPAGVPIAAVAYALWIGLTGAAVTFLAASVAGPLTVRPWTGLTDLVVATLALLWIVGPAAVVTLLVRDRITNVRGNLATGYRLRHPSLLLVPPAAVLAAGLVALAWLGSAPAVVLAVLVVGAVWFVVRAMAYAYRVFSLSIPVVGQVVAFLAAILGAVAVLTLGSQVVGRGGLIEGVATGLAARTGVEAVGTVPNGTAVLVGVAVPVVVWAVVTVPVVAAAGYVGVQTLGGLAVRVRQPTVRRPELRTGQRYPAFARPTASVSSGGSADADTRVPPRRASETADGTTAEDPADDSQPADHEEPAGPEVHVSHTRVYTPPEDAEVADPSTVAGWRAKRPHCPACGESYDPDSADGTCPECGADLGT